MDKTNRQKVFGTTQHLFNSFVNAGNHHKKRELGEPRQARHIEIPTDKLKLKNTSGGNLAVGRVLEIGSCLTTTINARNLQFTGSTPAPDGTKGIAVLLKSLRSNETGWCQASGICWAKVNINHEQQTRADVDNASTLLQSKWYGRAEILQKESSGTGEKTCLIRLGEMFRGPIEVELAADIAPGGSGNANVLDGDSLASPTSTITVHYKHMQGDEDAVNGSDAVVYWIARRQKFMIHELHCGE